MITIIHTERSHIAAIFAGFALLCVLIGWLRHYAHLDEQAAEAVRDYHAVLVMEKQLDRFDQVIAAYGIKPIPLAGEVIHE